MRMRVVVLALVLTCSGVGLYLLRAWAQEPSAYAIASMEAKLFYADQGTFSDNLINNPKYEGLFNTVIGEGSAGGSASDLLVVVKVKGTPGSYAGRNVQLKATTAQKTLLTRSSYISVLNDKGEGYVAFWVYDCTFTPLHLRAEITGQRTKAATYAMIPFEGGE